MLVVGKIFPNFLLVMALHWRILRIKFDELVKSRHSGGNRSPDAVPAEAGSHSRHWIPVFTGNPGFRLSPE